MRETLQEVHEVWSHHTNPGQKSELTTVQFDHSLLQDLHEQHVDHQNRFLRHLGQTAHLPLMAQKFRRREPIHVIPKLPHLTQPCKHEETLLVPLRKDMPKTLDQAVVQHLPFLRLRRYLQHLMVTPQ